MNNKKIDINIKKNVKNTSRKNIIYLIKYFILNNIIF